MTKTQLRVVDSEQPHNLLTRFPWLIREWWAYVLDDSRCNDKTRGDDEWLNGRLWQGIQNHDWRWSWWISQRLAYLFRCQCRARNHPYGVGWYNVAG